jgi:glycolate oxidase iron-sulfur subunit
MHLVDHARAHIERTFRRPVLDRLRREFLARLMPYPSRFRLSLYAAMLAKPFAPILAVFGFRRLAAMLTLAPWVPPRPSRNPGAGVVRAEGPRRGRVALMSGCVDQVVAPRVRDATVRLLSRHGIEVVLTPGEACCGSLSHHLGREHEAVSFVKNNVDAWTREINGEGLDAILVTASGCGTTVKDYGFMLRTDPNFAEKAARVSALARDISEYLVTLDLVVPAKKRGLRVAYHSACSMQHGQKVTREPKNLLARIGFDVRDVPEGHLCCGSAGTYNMLQPEIAVRLRDRKIKNIQSTSPQAIVAGNIGCLTQIASGTGIPVVHTVELLDWATGGPIPAAIRGSVLA